MFDIAYKVGTVKNTSSVKPNGFYLKKSRLPCQHSFLFVSVIYNLSTAIPPGTRYISNTPGGVNRYSYMHIVLHIVLAPLPYIAR